MLSPTRLITALSLVLSSQVIADTDLYLTNNSNDVLFIDVRHFGTDTLEEGNEWIQHEVELAPWTSAPVLSFNRWQGVKAGKEYNFETRVTNAAGDTVTLHQQLKGRWHSTSFTHGVSSSDNPLIWRSDRNIHRVNTDEFGERKTELAVKSESTWRFDDLYYSITPEKIDEQTNPDPNTLKIMTYNIWALPGIASKISERFALLPDHLKGYDVIALQEVFAGGREAFLRTLAEEYPYQTKMLNKPGVNVHDGGVTIVSRYPIVREKQKIYDQCSGADCFADKGINYAEVIKGGESYHIFATHAASFDTDEARKNRQLQFKQMRAMAESLDIPTNETVIYSGDMNVNKLKFQDDYKQMLRTLNASEPIYSGYDRATFDPRINSYAGNALSGGDSVEYLDYVLLDNKYGHQQENNNRVDVPRTTDTSVWGNWNLSDHQPVTAIIK
ncbi:sphingomyelin phosphodiesterase [Veronia pacifica]|uniref:Phospholipase n=1 Tax=Veronia pacifica TaxID=1080227 RepID=A0A1C3EDF3_9GAMM|nr:sphingomyelin phosphodiesterase [Veronia pacifica]ODA31230.1 phospholipase [Veronia pacifica]